MQRWAYMCGEVLGQRRGDTQLRGWHSGWLPWPITIGFGKGRWGLKLRGSYLAAEGEGEPGMFWTCTPTMSTVGEQVDTGALTLSEQLGPVWSTGPRTRGCPLCTVMGFHSIVLSATTEVFSRSRGKCQLAEKPV